MRHDTLYSISPGEEKTTYTTNVANYQKPLSDTFRWLAFQLNDSTRDLVLRNLITGSEKRFENVIFYWLGHQERTLLMETFEECSGTSTLKLKWVNLDNPKAETHTIWSDKDSLIKVGNIQFDKLGTQLLFTVFKDKTISVWYYKLDMDSALQKLSDHTTDIIPGSTVENAFFSSGDNCITCRISIPPTTIQPANYTAQVDVYSYRDSILQFKQLEDKYGPSTYLATIQAKNEKIHLIQKQNERILPMHTMRNSNYILVTDMEVDTAHDWPWWPFRKKSTTWLVSLMDGSRRQLNLNIAINTTSFYLSPDNQYLIYIDFNNSGYHSYDLSEGNSRPISGQIPGTWFHLENPDFEGYYDIVGVAGWLSNDHSVLVYDQYDIWQLDLSGKKPAKNITHGYGRRHNIKFRIIGGGGNKIFRGDEDLTLTAFSTTTKYNGFYSLHMENDQYPELLTMGPYTYYKELSQMPNPFSFDLGMQPIKAARANVWIVRRQMAASGPDYCITKDFKHYDPFTNMHPEDHYNWLTAELVNYSQLDGSSSQGVLYKPADFNPKKKYPLIIHYYEQLSYRLYEFPHPGFSNDNINIPWFVSRGYLVFVPDIHYKMAVRSGKVTGDYAVNSVLGAANYLAKRKYIDGDRMGIQGHSFGGGETLYIITHTNRFAAACAAAPTVSDEISSTIGFTRVNGVPIGGRFVHAEMGHDQIGATLWQRPDLYFKASPILLADKVTTPLLLMHNQKDQEIDWNQGVMIYMALRRLQKPVWLLQYDAGNHSVIDDKDAIDYTYRMTQFFDYYLKGSLPPKWMTQGVPAKLKGIDNGFELDRSGAKP